MKLHPSHREILTLIRLHSGKPAKDAFLNNYLGNDHPIYPINTPTLRRLARDWMKSHRDLAPEALSKILTSLTEGKSCTEKCMAGIVLNIARPAQRQFDPAIFDQWLNHLVGWVEVDTVCTGAYAVTEIPNEWSRWKRLLTSFSKSKNISKRRASLVLLCSPLRTRRDQRLLSMAFDNVSRLRGEKEAMITKAISWVLRSASVHHKAEVKEYLALNKDTLPKIAVRETTMVLTTGKKTKSNIDKS